MAFNKTEKKILDQVSGSKVGSDLLEEKIDNAEEVDSVSTPIIGSPIVMSAITGQVATAAWGAAADTNTIATSIKYRVCLSDVAVTSLNEARQLGEWQSRWSRNLTTMDIQGLFPSRNYFVTVFVKGHDDQAVVYASVMFTTIASAVATYYVEANAVDQAAGNFAVGELEATVGLTPGVDIFSTYTDAITATNGTGVETVIYGNVYEELMAEITITSAAHIHIIGVGFAGLERNIGFSTDVMLRDQFGPLTVVNLVFDGNHHTDDANPYILRSVGFDLEVHNCSFHNNWLPASNGRNILAFIGTPTISNCNITNTGRLGALIFNTTGAIFRWNTFTGQSSGNVLNYCAQITGDPSFTFTENRIHGALSNTTTDGSASGGLIATGAAAGTISFNEFILCQEAVGISDTGAIAVNGNTFSMCNRGVHKESTGPTVDATNNYWGTPSLNEAEPSGNITIYPKATSHKID